MHRCATVLWLPSWYTNYMMLGSGSMVYTTETICCWSALVQYDFWGIHDLYNTLHIFIPCSCVPPRIIKSPAMAFWLYTARLMPLPDDDFITHMKHLWLSASNPKKAKLYLLATISSEEIETAKKPVIVKNTQRSTVWVVRVFTLWVEEWNERHDQKCPFALAIQLSYVIGFAYSWRRPSVTMDSV